jgi:hypothetical protein
MAGFQGRGVIRTHVRTASSVLVADIRSSANALGAPTPSRSGSFGRMLLESSDPSRSGISQWRERRERGEGRDRIDGAYTAITVLQPLTIVAAVLSLGLQAAVFIAVAWSLLRWVLRRRAFIPSWERAKGR